jgi:hypothetical protein
MNTVAAIINDAALCSSSPELKALAFQDDDIPRADAGVKIMKTLRRLSVNLDKELVVFFDEADCLAGPALITFLAQIRDGYLSRHRSAQTKFPRSLALVGMRDIRDYVAQVRPDDQSIGLASPFNVKKESLRLANFTREEIGALYAQHTEATGQVFAEEAVERAWHWSEGQPWLVNALANEVVNEPRENDRSWTIVGPDVDQAARTLILRNQTHFDSLRERLKEARVRRVIEAVLVGAKKFPEEISDDDVQYTLDLGLLKKNSLNAMSYQPSNPIYQEVIIRTLTNKIEQTIISDMPILHENKWFNGDSIDISGLIKNFQIYWSENSEMYIKNNMIDSHVIESIQLSLEKIGLSNKFDILPYLVKNIENSLIDLTNESLSHLVLFAFMQRVLNGGADFIQREYALGAQRVDICISYKENRYPIEIKIKGHKSINESLEQLFGYMNKCVASEGWLIIFDKDFNKPWDEKLYWKTEKYNKKLIHIAGC